MTTTFASSLLDKLSPFLTPQADPSGAHAVYLTALSQMLEPLYGLVIDQGDDPDDPAYVFGWSSLLDVDACPTAFLPFLAQFVGAVIPSGSSDAVARQIIRAESGMQRGTRGAIVSAAQRNLSGTQSVTVFERTAADGTTADPYSFVLVVLTGEVVDATQLVADVDAVKPGGVVWTLIQTSTWTVAELELAYGSVTAVEAAFTSVAHLETDVT